MTKKWLKNKDGEEKVTSNMPHCYSKTVRLHVKNNHKLVKCSFKDVTELGTYDGVYIVCPLG